MRQSNIVAALLIGTATFGMPSSRGLCAEIPKITVDFKSNGIGVPPADFEFRRTGQGGVGRWAVVGDATATNGASIEQSSADSVRDRFPLAIYKPVFVKNLAIWARFKLIRGTTESAGLAVRVTSANDYYVVRASVSEGRIDFIHFTDGKMELVAGVDAEIAPNHWQTLEVVAEDNSFAISLDNNWVLTVFDKAIMRDGHIALWTQDDSVARFEDIEITPRAWTQEE